jgi:hypothetical protein
MDEMVSVDQATMPAIHTADAYARAWLSAPTQRLLCHFAAADADRPLPLVEADWEEVFQAVCSNGLLGLTQACLKRQPAGDYPPAAFRAWVRQAYLMNSLRMALRYRQIDRVLRQFAEHGPEMIVLKGPALAHTLYDDPAPLIRRPGSRVRERDWRRARAALVDLGFTPEEPDDHCHPSSSPRSGPMSTSTGTPTWVSSSRFTMTTSSTPVWSRATPTVSGHGPERSTLATYRSRSSHQRTN